MMGKMSQFQVKGNLSPFAVDHNVFHVIVEDLSRHPSWETKGMDMTVHKALQGAAIHKLHVHGPGKAQDHYKGVHGGGALGLPNLKISPVHLGLKPPSVSKRI